ncbi:MAG: ClC family H(+)/Cl(-) exchange transporter [Treponema sp.]|nr:ClC family H(+)/Cl(-) exchange transporter [Treponema sp.]
MKQNKKNLSFIIRRWYISRLALILQSIFTGFITGLVVVLFRRLLSHADTLRAWIYRTLPVLPPYWTAIWILALAGAGLFMGWASRTRPLIKGSGIPQVKGVLVGQLHMSWMPELPLKLAAGLLALGLGLSLGREGPSIQIGAYVGLAVLSIFRRSGQKHNYLISAAAASGLAAAFNAPLAGLVFALEELWPSFSPALIACTMGAAMMATTVAGVLLGSGTVFDFRQVEALPLGDLPWVVLLGIVCAALGHLFKGALYGSLNLYDRLRIPPLFRPLIPLAVSVPVGFLLFDLSGGGHTLIESLPHDGRTLRFIVSLLGGKLLYTALCYGSGAAGGIFLPLLACGALTGDALGTILSGMGYIASERVLNFIILGMAGFFASTAQAPVTGIVLILEMCGNFNHLSSLVLVSFSSFVTAELLLSRPVYAVLLERILSTMRKTA